MTSIYIRWSYQDDGEETCMAHDASTVPRAGDLVFNHDRDETEIVDSVLWEMPHKPYPLSATLMMKAEPRPQAGETQDREGEA